MNVPRTIDIKNFNENAPILENITNSHTDTHTHHPCHQQQKNIFVRGAMVLKPAKTLHTSSQCMQGILPCRMANFSATVAFHHCCGSADLCYLDKKCATVAKINVTDDKE